MVLRRLKLVATAIAAFLASAALGILTWEMVGRDWWFPTGNPAFLESQGKPNDIIYERNEFIHNWSRAPLDVGLCASIHDDVTWPVRSDGMCYAEDKPKTP